MANNVDTPHGVIANPPQKIYLFMLIPHHAIPQMVYVASFT